jgi:hypothetical protein
MDKRQKKYIKLSRNYWNIKSVGELRMGHILIAL